MGKFKSLFILVYILSFIIACNGSIIQLGHSNIEYDSSNRISKIQTFSDGRVLLSSNDRNIYILENTTIQFDQNQNYTFDTGIIFFTKNIKSTVFQKLFGKSIWGGMQFYRVALPWNFKSIKSDVSITYSSPKGEEIQKTVLNFLYSKHNHHYFGFFIPFSTYSNANQYSVDIIIYKSHFYNKKILGEIKFSQTIEKKDWGKQTIYFRKGKGKHKRVPDMKKFWKEHKLRKEIWEENHSHKFLIHGFSYPLEESNYITSEFGLRRIWRYTNGHFIRQNIHKGIDFGRKVGTPIYAPADGIVCFILEDSEFYGNNVIIDHGYSLYSNYAHLSKIAVRVGQKVKKGQLIGLVGKTGNVTGAHLHWETRIYGRPVDPRSLFGIEEIYKD